MLHWFFTILGNRNEPGGWYGFWSGFGGATSAVAVPFMAMFWLMHHTCHVHRCYRPANYALAGTPWRLCRKHHPDTAARLTVRDLKIPG